MQHLFFFFWSWYQQISLPIAINVMKVHIYTEISIWWLSFRLFPSEGFFFAHMKGRLLCRCWLIFFFYYFLIYFFCGNISTFYERRCFFLSYFAQIVCQYYMIFCFVCMHYCHGVCTMTSIVDWIFAWKQIWSLRSITCVLYLSLFEHAEYCEAITIGWLVGRDTSILSRAERLLRWGSIIY